MTPARKSILALGRKGTPRYVRVFREVIAGRAMIRVQWREGAARRTASFADTRNGLAEAKAFAEGRHEALSPTGAAAPALSLRALVTHYLTAKDGLKPNTLRLARDRWRAFELFIGKDRPASSVTREHLDQLKRQLLAMGRAPNQVRLILEEVRRVYLWGIDRDLVPPSKIATYRIALSAAVRLRGPKMQEFRADDRAAIIAQFDPAHPRQWRPFVVCTLLAHTGARVGAVLALRWEDVDVASRRIHWRAETDKTARERWQPVSEAVLAAYAVARRWQGHDGYTGPYILYGVQRRTRGQPPRVDPRHVRQRRTMEGITVHEQPWSYQAFIAQLHGAERRAGLAPAKWKGAHAFRRGVTGDVRALTGSDKDAADYIGDRSVRVVQRAYLLEREDRLRAIAERMGTEADGAERHGMQSGAPDGAGAKSEVVDASPLTKEPAVGIEPTTA